MPEERWHGTVGGYTNHRDRCDRCRAAWSKYMRDRRAAYGSTGRSVHGTEQEYGNGCRCSDCKIAHRAYRSRQRAVA